MLVYGDPQFTARCGNLRTHLENVLRNAPQGESALNFWRMILIRSGQMEQGVADAQEEGRMPSVIHQAEHLTDVAAKEFFREWSKTASAQTRDVLRSAKALSVADELELRIKVPEGFEFYALFPEQYGAAAMSWAKQHCRAECKNVLVVGIRSIGTSLSALVKTVLQSVGWNVRRLTVRPKGHPFQRELMLRADDLGDAAFALIVDEGPGISGSSMASVAEALVACGFSKSNLAFFPGHGNGPGHAASEQVREWWRTTPRFLTPLEEMQWSGKSLKDLLAISSQTFFSDGRAFAAEQTLTVQDVTGGGWVSLIFPNGEQPTVCWPFERLKFRCVAPEGQAVLWKFSGLGAFLTTPALDPAEEIDRKGEEPDHWSEVQRLQTLATTHGFCCTPWIMGTGSRPVDVNSHTLRSIAHYLFHTAGKPLGEKETVEALEGLNHMLLCNSREKLGDEAVQRAERIGHCVRSRTVLVRLELMPACSDGRMAPHEWLRTSDGCLIKTDSTGNLTDHTLVGRQPLLWDIAGVIIEWKLSSDQTVLFEKTLRELGLDWMHEEINFYLAAFAAFKLGQVVLCLQMGSPDPEYTNRMERAVSYYSSKLQTTLYLEAVPSFIESTRGP
ncbi:MAG: glutamate-semialdehyde -aminomutase-like protein [Verrucomicrobiales bacterium]|nr:glutamate-semialdehyde -aminomutase-like protein [Verrucomicrobiales bacterium]